MNSVEYFELERRWRAVSSEIGCYRTDNLEGGWGLEVNDFQVFGRHVLSGAKKMVWWQLVLVRIWGNEKFKICRYREDTYSHDCLRQYNYILATFSVWILVTNVWIITPFLQICILIKVPIIIKAIMVYVCKHVNKQCLTFQPLRFSNIQHIICNLTYPFGQCR